MIRHDVKSWFYFPQSVNLMSNNSVEIGHLFGFQMRRAATSKRLITAAKHAWNHETYFQLRLNYSERCILEVRPFLMAREQGCTRTCNAQQYRHTHHSSDSQTAHTPPPLFLSLTVCVSEDSKWSENEGVVCDGRWWGDKRERRHWERAGDLTAFWWPRAGNNLWKGGGWI